MAGWPTNCFTTIIFFLARVLLTNFLSPSKAETKVKTLAYTGKDTRHWTFETFVSKHKGTPCAHLGAVTPAFTSGKVTHMVPNNYLSSIVLPHSCLRQETLEHKAKSCPPFLVVGAFGTKNGQWHHLQIHLDKSPCWCHLILHQSLVPPSIAATTLPGSMLQ